MTCIGSWDQVNPLKIIGGVGFRVRREIRRAKRGHKIVLADKAKENPKSF